MREYFGFDKGLLIKQIVPFLILQVLPEGLHTGARTSDVSLKEVSA